MALAPPLASTRVLLTITTTHRPATDLGFLLHKHLDRLQTFSVPFGEAYVFYRRRARSAAWRSRAAVTSTVRSVGCSRRR